MLERYSRNMNSLSAEEIQTLHSKSVCVIGCGGLGGHICETMARIGVLNITVVDFDSFDESNLNRQLFASESTIGRVKTEIAAKRLKDVNSSVQVNIVNQRLCEANAVRIIKGHDLVMDALDSVPPRLHLFKACEKLNMPLVHGSIGGWYGQVSTVFPGDNVLAELYADTSERGAEESLGNLPFTAQATAAFQCAEAIKILTGRGASLRNSILRTDFLHNELDIVQLAE